MIEAVVILAIVVFIVWFIKVWANPYRVVVRYKSGHKMKVNVSEWNIKTNALSTGKSFSWKQGRLHSQKIMLLGVDDVESVIIQARYQRPFG